MKVADLEKTAKERKGRLPYPDMVRGFAIILVVLGHCIQMGSGAAFTAAQQFYEDRLYQWIYTFHMPLFMLISGYFAAKSLGKITAGRPVVNGTDVCTDETQAGSAQTGEAGRAAHRTLLRRIQTLGVRFIAITDGSAHRILLRRIQTLLVPIAFWTIFETAVAFVRTYVQIPVDDPVFADKVRGLVQIELTQLPRNFINELWFLWAELWCFLAIYVIRRHLGDSWKAYLILELLFFVTPDAWNFGVYKYMFSFYLVGYWYAEYPKCRKTSENPGYQKNTRTPENPGYLKDTKTPRNPGYSKNTRTPGNPGYQKNTRTLENPGYLKDTKTQENLGYSKNTKTPEDPRHLKITKTLEDRKDHEKEQNRNALGVVSSVLDLLTRRSWPAILLWGAAFLVLFIFYRSSIMIYLSGYRLNFVNGWHSAVLSVIKDAYRFLIGMAGSMFFLLLLGQLFDRVDPAYRSIPARILTALGRQTMGIYILSGYYIIFGVSNLTADVTPSYARNILETIVVLALSYATSRLLSKITFLRKTVGK